MENIKLFLTENLAGLMLSGAVFFMTAAYKRRSRLYLIPGGLFFGLLALTKSIYCYAFFVIAGITLLTAIANKNNRTAILKGLAYFVVSYSVLVMPWSIRNYLTVGSTSISSRGGFMLTIRDFYGRADFEEFKALFWYSSPLKDWVRPTPEMLERVKRLDRSNPEGFYLASRKYAGALSNRIGTSEAEVFLKKEAIKHIISNPFRHIAVSVALAFNGLFAEGPRWMNGKLVLTRLHTGLLLLFSLLMAGLIVVVRRDIGLMMVIGPAYFSIGFHALVSNSLPRYNEPIIHLMWISFSIVVYLICSKTMAISSWLLNRALIFYRNDESKTLDLPA